MLHKAELDGFAAGLKAKRAGIEGELKNLNQAWEPAPPVGAPEPRAALPLPRLEELFPEATYIRRWLGQLQERAVQLSI